MHVKGGVPADENYQLYSDNILDLTHANFVHSPLKSNIWTIGDRKFAQDGDVVRARYSRQDDYLADGINMMRTAPVAAFEQRDVPIINSQQRMVEGARLLRPQPDFVSGRQWRPARPVRAAALDRWGTVRQRMSVSTTSGRHPAAMAKASGPSPAGQGSGTTECGERPVLLLLAGLLCDATVWHDVAAHLADIVDVRFFSFPDHRSIPAMAEQVLAQAPERFALAGHSMGGRVALELFRQAPQRVNRLALLNTGVHPLKDGETAGRAELVELARSAGLAALADVWLPPMMSDRGRADKELMEQLRAMILRATAESFAGQVEALLCRPDASDVLPMIQVPLLLLSGSEDRWSPFSQHADMHAAALHGQLVEIAGAGHMAPAEQPAAVAAALRAWMAEPGL